MRIILTLSILLAPSQIFSQTFQDFLTRVNNAAVWERPAIVDSFMTAVPAFPFVEGDSLAHFIYRGGATSASVPGDMNGWSATAYPMTNVQYTDFWYRISKFEPDARLDYKFVLNGSTWILDPRNPRTVMGGYGPNSELRMPAHIPPPEIVYYANIPHGTLRDTTYYSVNLGNSRTIRVYLPPGYDSSQDSFGVALFHDGLEYVSLAYANNVLDYLTHHNRIRPLIGVFVPPVNRTAEYAGGQQNQFTTFIVNELMPYIDSRYRTRRNPADRAVLGASNGGNISLWIGYNHPGVFGNIAAYSSNIQSSISTGFQNSPTLNLKLYLDLGTYDIASLIPLVRNFIPILQSKGYPYLYQEFHEGHSWGNWRAHIDDALEYLFPPTPTSVRTEENPDAYSLEQNYPNPFNPTTTIKYSVPPGRDLVCSADGQLQNANSQLGFGASNLGFVSLKVFDVLGREVATLVNEMKEPGAHTVQWHASGMASGVYFYRLIVGSFLETKKLVLAK